MTKLDKRTALALAAVPALQIATPGGEVYMVEEVEPGVYQAVFPTAQADHSALFTTRLGAWGYILETMKEAPRA